MSPKEHVDLEGEPQTPEEDEDVSEGDSAGIQNQEQDGAEAKPMTMEERKAKMQELRAKLVRRVHSLSHNCPPQDRRAHV